MVMIFIHTKNLKVRVHGEDGLGFVRPDPCFGVLTDSFLKKVCFTLERDEGHPVEGVLLVVDFGVS